MKRFTLFMTCFILSVALAQAANFFWIGGASGAWNVPANWSTTKTGVGGTRLPARADQVYFDTTATGPVYSVNVTGLDVEISSMRILPGISVKLVGIANSFKIAFPGYTSNSLNCFYLAGSLDDGGNTIVLNGTVIVNPSPVAKVRLSTVAVIRGGTELTLNNVDSIEVGQVLQGRNIFSGTEIVAVDAANKKITLSYPVLNTVGVDSVINIYTSGVHTGTGKLVFKGASPTATTYRLDASGNWPMQLGNIQIGTDTTNAVFTLRGTVRVSGNIDIKSGAALYSAGGSFVLKDSTAKVNVDDNVLLSVNNRRNGLAAAYNAAQSNQAVFFYKANADVRKLVTLGALSTVIDSAAGTQSMFIAPLNYGNLTIYGETGTQSTPVLANGTANGSVNVNGTLTLVNTNITIGQSDTLTILSGNAIKILKSGTYIVSGTTSNNSRFGHLRVKNITGQYTFPIGSATGYAPITLNVNGGANDIQVATSTGTTLSGMGIGLRLNAADSAKVLNQFWRVYNHSFTGSYTAAVNWTAPSIEPSGFQALTQIGVAKNVNNVWGIATGTGDNTANTASSDAIADTMVFLGVSELGVTLPVVVSNVGVSAVNQLPVVKWTATNEVGVAAYVVEKAIGSSSSFVAIGQLSAANATSYQFVDAANTANSAYYRIKIVGVDGSQTYSAVVAYAAANARVSVQVYPTTITNRVVNIALRNFAVNGGVSVRVIDAANGKVHAVRAIDNVSAAHNYQLQLPSTLHKGSYVIEVASGAQKISKVVMVD